jgi:hypothetical protein
LSRQNFEQNVERSTAQLKHEFNIFLLVQVDAQIDDFEDFAVVFFVAEQLFELSRKLRIVIVNLIVYSNLNSSSSIKPVPIE